MFFLLCDFSKKPLGQADLLSMIVSRIPKYEQRYDSAEYELPSSNRLPAKRNPGVLGVILGMPNLLELGKK